MLGHANGPENRAAAARLGETVAAENSACYQKRKRRRALAAQVDALVDELIEALAPDAEAQEAVRRIRQGLGPTLDQIVEEAVAAEEGGR